MAERRLGRVGAHLSAASSVATAVPAAAAAAAPWGWSGEGGSGQLFELQGHAAFVITPTTRAAGPIPWVWYAPTLLPGLPDTADGGTADPGAEVFMFEKFLKAGVGVAGIDAGESYGSPAGQQLFTALYDELTQQGGDVDHVQRFSYHPVLLGRSRGGLQTLAWAAEHADRVGAWAGIYPVCDLASFPGLDKATGAYDLTEQELQAALDVHNPVSKMAAVAAAVRTMRALLLPPTHTQAVLYRTCRLRASMPWLVVLPYLEHC
jgi:hypothetical protein